MRALLCGVIVGSVAGSAAADLTKLDFEEQIAGQSLVVGQIVPLTDLYAAQGVTFSSSVTGSKASLTYGHEYPSPAGRVHLSAQAFVGDVAVGFPWDPVVIDFATPVNYFETIALDVGFADLIIEAWDGGEVVRSVLYEGTTAAGEPDLVVPGDRTKGFVSGTGDVSGVLSIFTLPTGREFDRIVMMQRYPSQRVTSGDVVYAFDYIKYGVVAIPLPPAAWAGLLGLGAVMGVRRLQRR